MGQSNESAQRSSPQSDSDSDLLIDSSEEEDSSEENEYQADGFVVSDDEGNEINPELDLNSDDEPAPKLVLKRLKKGVKRKRHQIYQEDLDLVAEYQGLLPSSKRQKTKADETNSHSITMTGSGKFQFLNLNSNSLVFSYSLKLASIKILKLLFHIYPIFFLLQPH